MANSFPDVDVLRGRKPVDRSCKIAVSFHLFLKLLNANQLKNFFVVSVCGITLTMNLAFSPSLNFAMKFFNITRKKHQLSIPTPWMDQYLPLLIKRKISVYGCRMSRAGRNKLSNRLQKRTNFRNLSGDLSGRYEAREQEDVCYSLLYDLTLATPSRFVPLRQSSLSSESKECSVVQQNSH
jgi:hypothetical protein